VQPSQSDPRIFYLLAALCAGALAMLASFILTPIVQRAAEQHGAAHEPRSRDLHLRPIARWGGLAIYVAFVLALLGSAAVLRYAFGTKIAWHSVNTAIGVLLAGTLLSVVGAIDDLHDVPPGKQMLAQVLCAAALIPLGIRIDVLSDPFHPGAMLSLGAWSYPLTLLWIVGVTNAVNWIDGLDGLAAGICAIASATLAFLALQSTQPALALITSALCGSLLGFLRYNFSPARIYMGGGALFVGSTLATVATAGAFKTAATTAILVPVLVLGVPIFDTLFVIIRRLRQGRPIYQADKNHVHHRLLARGFSHRQTVLILYALSLGLSAIAVIVFHIAP
jgi:UDP-GlcNAc:undecaprenyl-phosphate GlcNAc-1-phosphate transferase